nr:MAG TPA: hypothetical protein [Caudoviricetes sp.]
MGIAWENVGFWLFLAIFPKLGVVLSRVLCHFFGLIFAIIY